MKRRGFLFVSVFVICFICLMPFVNVKAANAVSWSVDGQLLSKGSSNSSGNVVWSVDENYDGGVLTLDNYDGGQIGLGCYGTCGSQSFAIKLVGDNKITVTDGVGFYFAFPVTFIGDGTLTIEALVPINDSVDIPDNFSSTHGSKTITFNLSPSSDEKVEIEQQPDVNEDEKDEDEDVNVNDEENDNEKTTNLDVYTIINFGLLAINIIILLILIIKMSKKEK